MPLFVLFHLLKRLDVLPPERRLAFSTSDITHQVLSSRHFLLLSLMFLDIHHGAKEVRSTHGPFERLGNELIVRRQVSSAFFASVDGSVEVLGVSEAHVAEESW